jgi:serine/threonine-protein kinase ULK2
MGMDETQKPIRPRLPMPKPLISDASVIPGESEEDGKLRQDYVLVGDTQAIEFNRKIDGVCYSTFHCRFLRIFWIELTAVQRKPLQERQIPPTPSLESGADDSIPPTPTTFPPPPNPFAPPPLSSSPSSIASRAATNALNRAINLASKKLFGTTARSSPPKRDLPANASLRPQIITMDAAGEDDPLEDELLRDLEDLAQKTDVLTHWADEMYDYVRAVPQSKNHI